MLSRKPKTTDGVEEQRIEDIGCCEYMLLYTHSPSDDDTDLLPLLCSAVALSQPSLSLHALARSDEQEEKDPFSELR